MMDRRGNRGHGAARVLVIGTILVLATAALAADRPGRTWGVGWDDGPTVRRWLGPDWELAVAAGPDDFLAKSETRAWDLARPVEQQGALEVPSDLREEQGWVRFQVGRRVADRDDLALAVIAQLTYNWIDAQERTLVLDDLIGDYDTWERDRFTERWLLAAGLRPSWRPFDNLTVEFAFGLRFVWESWEQTSERTYAGVPGGDRAATDGHSRAFQDFGWEGASSLQFLYWF